MKTRLSTLAASAALFAFLPACAADPGMVLAVSPQSVWQAPDESYTRPGQGPAFDSVDSYKYHVARHIMRYNADHTFSGKLPPMLPAVVVLRITVDEMGRMTDCWVQRSPEDDNGAAKIAVASMRRAGVLPRPLNLASGPNRSLSYSETFLFNDDYRFQIRTLAPIQTED
jgi:protein TonB